MKNAKAPIGDFLNRYHLIKNDCLKLSNIKNNKYLIMQDVQQR